MTRVGRRCTLSHSRAPWFISEQCVAAGGTPLATLQAREVRHLEEQRARGGDVRTAVDALEHRAVPKVRDGPRRQLVRREEIAEDAPLRAVELRDGPHEEPRVELVGVAQVDDV